MEIPPRTGRGNFWIGILGSPVMWGMNVVLGILLWGDVIADTLPFTAVYFRYLSQVTELPWYWKVIVTLGVNIVLLTEVSFWMVRNRERQRDEYCKTLQQIEEARPNIVLQARKGDIVEHTQIRAIGDTRNIVSFISVPFVNTPAGLPFPNAVARDVRATIRFFEPVEGGKLLLAMEGKWADDDQPSLRDWRQTRNDLLKMNFEIAEEHSLDIAFRDDQTGEFYAFNHANYTYPQMKKPEHLLAGQGFLVRISLLGPWVDENFEILFEHNLSGTKVAFPLTLVEPIRAHG